MSRLTRLAVFATLVAALAACSFSVGEGAVSADDVEAQAQEQFAEQFPVDSVECPEDLPAEVGASITCELVSEGTTHEMTATVSTVDGDVVNFDLEITS